MVFERLGRENMRDETGAAMRVSTKEPTNRPGRFDKPNEMAPSSRNGRTTKYALKICTNYQTTKKTVLEKLKQTGKEVIAFLKRETHEEEAEEGVEHCRGLVRVHRNEHGDERIEPRPPHRVSDQGSRGKTRRRC